MAAISQCAQTGDSGRLIVNAFALYKHYIALSFRGQMQYRASFIMLTISIFLSSGLEFIGIWAIFDRFGQLKSWTLAEVALFYGIVNMGMAIAKAVSRGFDHFATTIRNGDFDRLLLRPRNTVLQLLGQELQLMRIGQFTQGFLVLCYAAYILDITWTVPKITLVMASTLACASVFGGLFVLRATLCFWTTESLDLINAVSYGGQETARYPLSIYRKWFRRFFTYVIPLACISYYPALVILDRPDALGSPIWFQWTAPAIGFLFFFLTLQFWRFGTRHYRSTGS